MFICMGLCEYFHAWKRFATNRTYENCKRCTQCNYIVNKEEFPDANCYCCGARYRIRSPQSIITKREARKRKKERELIERLNYLSNRLFNNIQ